MDNLNDKGMQIDLFDLLYDNYYLPNDRPVRLIEMFAGIGTQRMGLERFNIPYEVVGIVEVDKYAVLSYACMHTDFIDLRKTWFQDKEIKKEEMILRLQDKMLGYDFKNGKHTITNRNNTEVIKDYYLADLLSNNYGDISKVKGVDFPHDIDMLTYSFPCTDLSKAGKQKGLKDTRSGLVYQVFRIIEELESIGNKPKTLIMENVVDLVQSKFIDEFQDMQREVEDFGYINYTLRMNAKDYGVAQSRDRVFMVSLPQNSNYNEPQPFKLVKRLRDYLENDVDEKYYLSDQFIKSMTDKKTGGFNRSEMFSQCVKVSGEWEHSTTITTRDGSVATSTFIKIEDSQDTICLNSQVDGKQPSLQDRVYSIDGSMTAITTGFHPSIQKDSRIRKLTPLECWRLMGIDDHYFYKASKYTSNAQLYKQAGNAIVVDVFGLIVKQMYKGESI